MDSRQRDLLEARARYTLAPPPRTSSNRHASGPAARRRDDAEGALFGAAGLHPQRERRSAGNAGLEDGTASPLSLAKTIGGCQVRLKQRDEPRLVVVRNDSHHARQAGHLVAPTGRVAAGDNDPGGWIDSRNAPDGLTRRLIGACCDRTRVHDDDVGLFGRNGGRALRAKAFLDTQRIGLVDSAAEGDHGVLHLKLSTDRLSLRVHRVLRGW